MNFNSYLPDKHISLFVKSILAFEETESTSRSVLPFFADGCPGLMFQQTENGLWVQPHNKKMPASFLYGQTIKPIELHMGGNYAFIVFQLYPFVLKTFFNITAKDINDDCYNLQQVKGWETIEVLLLKESHVETQIEIISNFLLNIFTLKKEELDLTIRQSLQIIFESKAQVNIKQLCAELNITTRTFERRFLNEVGITAKQFLQITKFQQSFEQLTLKEFTKLTDVVYNNGFSDQSHFIRVFKAFTGTTPKSFIRKSS